MKTVTECIEMQLESLCGVEEEEQIAHIVDVVNHNFKDSKCTYCYAGGFDSPGYDIDCYVIAYLEDDKIKCINVQIERC